MTTTSKSQSEAETLTAAVSTAIAASQQLTEALKAIASIVSTAQPKSAEGITTKSSDLSTLVLPKRRGRPPKTVVTTTVSEAQDLGTTSTTAESENTKCGNKDTPEVSTSASQSGPEKKKKGASPETLARARAALAQSRLKKSREKNPPLEVPLTGWPFPTDKGKKETEKV
jgi:hypothetical protein